jgi:hypothetical protein
MPEKYDYITISISKAMQLIWLVFARSTATRQSKYQKCPIVYVMLQTFRLPRFARNDFSTGIDYA